MHAKHHQTLHAPRTAAGQQFATQAGNNAMQGANALAANQLAQGNIWNNAINQAGAAWQRRTQQQPWQTPGYGGFGGMTGGGGAMGFGGEY